MSDAPEAIPAVPEQDNSAVVVAAIALRIIDKLNNMVIMGLTHDDASYGELFGATTYFTSVLDGKCDNPVEMAGGFVAACQIIDKSLLDEIDRVQHFLSEQVEKARLAESRALINEQYAGWYLRLRDGESGDAMVMDGHRFDAKMLSGEELDQHFEDLDGETEDISDFQLPQQ